MLASASSRPVDQFAEHISVMKAIYQEYQKQDDFDSVRFIEGVVRDVQEVCTQRQGAVKEAVRGMSQQVDSLEASSRYPQPEGSHERKVAALRADIRDIQASLQEMQANERDVDQQREDLSARASSLAARMAQLDAAVGAEEPALRHQLSLFAHISKITWRLDQEHRIAGTVSDPQRGDIMKVDIDPGAMSRFEAVNKLWDIIA